jgi:hypothetical protein
MTEDRACATGPEADTLAATATASPTGATKATMRSPMLPGD